MRFNQIFLIALLFVSGAVFGQNFTYTNGSLEVDVIVQNPCMNGVTLNRGYIAFIVVNTADGQPARLNNIVGNGGAGPNFFTPTLIPEGDTLYFFSNNSVIINSTSFTPNIGAGSYEFIIEDFTATEFISTFSPTVSGLTLTTLADIVINQNMLVNNTDCSLPLEGQIVASITGGSLGLVPGTPPAEQTSPESSFNYTWTSNNGVIPTSHTGTWDGTTPLDLAALLSLSALPGGTYTFLVEDNYSSCSETRQFTISDPSPDNSFTVGTTTPNICVGTDGVVTLSGSGDGSVSPGVVYEVYNTTTVPAGVPTGITLTETGGALSFTIPTALIATPGTYTFRIFGDNGDCTPVFMTGSASITVSAIPTITLGINPSVCLGASNANLTYSATTGSPNQYSIDFDAAAETQGFADVTNLTLPASPIGIVVPGTAVVGTYNATLTIRNSTSGCSSSRPISVTINAIPTITLGANPAVCSGATSANLTYTATTGGPNRYSINFNGAAEAQGFADVTNGVLPTSPIVLTVPGAAATGTYNATITVRNNVTNCVSAVQNISVTINPSPTITLGMNPSVCAGETTANLTYSAVTGSPTQLSINFDAAAEAQGFADVTNGALPASPIVITVPGGATAGTYNATLSVRNNTTGCSSAAQPITVTINPSPTITLGTNPAVCLGATSANLTYSAITGAPNQFTIDFNAAAEAQGFTDVTNATLPASPIVITIPGGAIAGTYNATLTVRNTTTNCADSGQPISVTIGANPTITLGTDPSVCSGATSANLTYSATTGSPNQYSINFDAAAEAQGFADVSNITLPASPIVITVPGAAAIGTYNATLTVHNSTAGCSSTAQPISVTITTSPTINLGTSPSVCLGATNANLTYSGTTGSPNQYSIDFNAAAEAQGFADVTNVTLNASPIVITVPGGAIAGTYNATLTVHNTVAGCSSTGQSISVTINALPTITLGTNPEVCAGTTSANLTFSATTGSPNRYSINFNPAAEAQGFADITNAVLSTSPIVITVPGAAVAGTYNATLTVRSNVTNCVSTVHNISVTINPTPAITLGTNPTVCLGAATANLTYSTPIGSPDQFTVDFDAAAEAQGFTDIVNAILPASPIVITIPGAAVVGTYNATLTVRNTSTNCAGTGQPISVTISNSPTITLGANPSVCTGATSANLTYSATTASPDQFSIDFDAAAEAQGFTDVTNATLNASPIVITVPGGAVIGTYNATFIVHNTTAGCSSAGQSISVTIETTPTITLGTNPSVCLGATTANVTYSATTGSPNQFSIDFNAAAEAQGFADITNATLTASPIVITVPGAAVAGTYNATLTVRNSVAGCGSSSQAISVTINAVPTITLGANPSVCIGTSNANLTYSATTGSPNQYSIDFNAAAEAQGFTDIVNATLTASPIVIPIPGGAVAGTYNASLIVRNNTTGCSASAQSISVTINPSPTIALGTNPSVCAGTTSTNLTYSATTGSPDEYSIDFNAAAEAQGFADVTNATLTASPIIITVPGGAAPGTYNATLNVLNNSTGCSGAGQTISVTINPSPTITLGANPLVCAGATSANLTYSATTGSPNQFSINFNAAAEAQGFTDVVNATLTTSPIVITVPGTAVVGTYNATLTVRNSGGGCTGASQSISVTINTSPNAGLDNSVSACSAETAFDLFASLDGTPDSGGTWTDLDGSGATITGNTIDLTSAAVGTYDFRYTVTGTAPCASASAIVSVTVINSTPDAGSDNTVSACENDAAFDLFGSLGGTPDPGGSWTDMDTSGATINGDEVDLTGVAIGTYRYQYTVNAGTCGTSSAIVTVDVIGGPDAGLDNSVSACNTETAFDLFASLDGTPDTGGTWTDMDASGALTVSTINTTSLAAGTYRYQYTVTATAPCTDASAIVTVTVVESPDAGTDNTVSACNNDSAFDLFASLAGTPQGGGAWTQLTGATRTITTNTVDFVGATAGAYTFEYRIEAAPCADAVAVLTVNVVDSPDAGSDNAVTVCNTETAFDLFANLNGTPDSGGTWADLDASGALTGSTVNTTSLAAGSYRFEYTVTGATPCADATAVVTVDVITTAPSAGNDNTVSACNTDTAFDLFGSLLGSPNPGGTWTDMDASGAVITGDDVNLVGVVPGPYRFQYTITVAGCGSSSAIVTVDVEDASNAGTSRSVTACTTNTAFSLLGGLGGTPDNGGTWTDLDGSGAVIAGNFADFSGTTPGSYRYQYTVTGTAPCANASAILTVQVNICAGGNCNTVIIIPEPSPATCTLSNGSIHFNIDPAVPAINNIGVHITIVGPVSRTNLNNPDFAGLPIGEYDYTIQYGDPGCIIEGKVTVDQSGTVGVPEVSDPISPSCFGTATGAVTIDVNGETGNPLQWSLTPADPLSWVNFNAGQSGGVTGLPAGNLLISIRRTSADPCNAAAFVTITETASELTATFTTTSATCGNSDGSITVTPGGPYSYEVDGVPTVPVANVFPNLNGGNHIITLVHLTTGCERDITVTVPFPGLVDTTPLSSSSGSCTAGSAIFFFIENAGSVNYEIGFTTDFFNEPTNYSSAYYNPPVSPSNDGFVQIPGLPRGDYYIWVRSASVQCPTRINASPVVIGGPYAVSFEIGCRESNGDLSLTNITGAPGTLFTYEIDGPSLLTGTFMPDIFGNFVLSGFGGNVPYKVRLIQDQNIIAGCPDIRSIDADAPNGSLDIISVDNAESFPDQPTGTMLVKLQESGSAPYEVWVVNNLTLISTDTLLAVRNPVIFESNFNNLDAGSYTVYAEDARGCRKMISNDLPLDTDIFIPNIFTPNDDGLNENFYVRNLPDGSKLIVTDRWGKEVYSSNNYNLDNLWDGGGSPDGVYFYRLQIKGGDKYTGWVEILRGTKP